MKDAERRVAPWPDCNGTPIREGDVLCHPDGDRGTVVFLDTETHLDDQWRVRYEDDTLSRLALQVGGKGQAVVSPQGVGG